MMSPEDIDSFVHRDITRSTVREFCDKTISDYDGKIAAPIKAYIICIKNASNGYTNAIRLRKKYFFAICINIYPIVNDRESTLSMKWLHIYAIILHELMHIELMICQGQESDYLSFLSFLEESREKGVFLFSRIKNWITTNKKNLYHSYYTSSTEMICRYNSLQDAFECFNAFLSQIEVEQISRTIEAMQFQNMYLEIGYTVWGTLYNKFAFILDTQRTIKRNKLSFYNNPILGCMFYPDGTIKNIDVIFTERKNHNDNLVKGILLRMLLYFDTDYSSIIQADPDLKEFLQTLINEYSNSLLYYFDHMDMGTIFSDDIVLRDNTMVLIRNLDYCHKLLDLYKMENRVAGGAILVE